ncbi:MAG: hypothetical protein JNL12_01255 [Planctomycetes bacterium]|nr:hypothetical protein [Planctomycetota bacterium]
MRFALPWALGVPIGLAGIVGSLVLAGGHPQQLLQTTALLLVGGTAFGGLLLLRGAGPFAAFLRTLLFGAPDDASARQARLGDVVLFERLALLGGCLALFVGGTTAIAEFATPEHTGPALAVALFGLTSALLLQLLVALPLKQHLLPPMGAGARLPLRAVSSRVLHALGTAALLLVGVSFATSGARPGTATLSLPLPTVMLTMAAIVPSLLAAPKALLAGPATRTRWAYLADGLWGTGALAAATGIAQVFAVLDQPRLLPPGVAAAFASFVLPAALAALLTLRSTFADDDTATTGGGKRSLGFGFAILVLGALAGMVLLVLLLLGRLTAP